MIMFEIMMALEQRTSKSGTILLTTTAVQHYGVSIMRRACMGGILLKVRIC